MRGFSRRFPGYCERSAASKGNFEQGPTRKPGAGKGILRVQSGASRLRNKKAPDARRPAGTGLVTRCQPQARYPALACTTAVQRANGVSAERRDCRPLCHADARVLTLGTLRRCARNRACKTRRLQWRAGLGLHVSALTRAARRRGGDQGVRAGRRSRRCRCRRLALLQRQAHCRWPPCRPLRNARHRRRPCASGS